MATVIYEGECCEDCLLYLANGEAEGVDCDTLQAAISARHPVGHPVPACEEDCEGWFSWRECQCCGSQLGGNRHPFAVLN